MADDVASPPRAKDYESAPYLTQKRRVQMHEPVYRIRRVR